MGKVFSQHPAKIQGDWVLGRPWGCSFSLCLLQCASYPPENVGSPDITYGGWTRTNQHPLRLTPALIHSSPNWRRPKCPSAEECISGIRHIHTREHHSAVKRGEALTLATPWMDPENTMLSERSQTQKDTQGVIPWIGNVRNRQIHRHREWVPGCQGLGVMLMGTGFPFGGMECSKIR